MRLLSCLGRTDDPGRARPLPAAASPAPDRVGQRPKKLNLCITTRQCHSDLLIIGAAKAERVRMRPECGLSLSKALRQAQGPSAAERITPFAA
jgi:hypothetical protein